MFVVEISKGRTKTVLVNGGGQGLGNGAKKTL